MPTPHTSVRRNSRSPAPLRSVRLRLRSVRAPAALAASLILAAPALLDAQSRVFQSEDHAFRLVTVVDGLEHPWGLAFLPGGDMLVTERPGRLRIIRNGTLLPGAVPGVPEVRAGGQGGLLDVALHPDFASNRLIYLSFSKPSPDGEQGTTAVVRARFENDRLTNVEEIFVAEAWRTGRGHHGSRLAFDRDGHLFVTVGDRQVGPGGNVEAQLRHPSQDLSTHMGKVLRLHDDGRVPADNPFVGRAGALPEIWSYGHRNPQGLAVHPTTGDVWANEHGPQGGDELNLVLPGRNYGWPVIGYGVNYGAGSQLHASTQRQGMEQPAHYWVPSIATSGLMIYAGDRFPAWRGSAFSGGMSNQHQVLSRVALDGRRVVREELLLPGELRIRDVRQSPDGYIYLVVDHRGGDRTPIVRLEPVGEEG